MKLLLVQHGEVVADAVDPRKPLSPEGVRTCTPSQRPAAVWSSRQRHRPPRNLRAEQTAEILGKALALPVVPPRDWSPATP